MPAAAKKTAAADQILWEFHAEFDRDYLIADGITLRFQICGSDVVGIARRGSRYIEAERRPAAEVAQLMHWAECCYGTRAWTDRLEATLRHGDAELETCESDSDYGSMDAAGLACLWNGHILAGYRRTAAGRYRYLQTRKKAG